MSMKKLADNLLFLLSFINNSSTTSKFDFCLLFSNSEKETPRICFFRFSWIISFSIVVAILLFFVIFFCDEFYLEWKLVIVLVRPLTLNEF